MTARAGSGSPAKELLFSVKLKDCDVQTLKKTSGSRYCKGKKMLKRVKWGCEAVMYGFMTLGLAAKAKKDITIHGRHDEHNPCSCDKACLRCLWN
jgi:hypothetical protein